jgi:N utilization substance protein A
LAAKLTGWRIDIKSASTFEAEKASAIPEPAVAAVEPSAEPKETAAEIEGEISVVEEPVPELISSEDLILEEPSEEVVEEDTTTAIADYELVLASEVSSEAPPASPQIRFAEDILPAKAPSAKKGKGTKRDTELREKDIKPKKGRQKRVSYIEDDDAFED